MRQRGKGILSVIISSLTFGLAPFFVSIVYACGGAPSTVTALRFLSPLPVMLVCLKAKKIHLRLTGAEVKKVAVLAIFGYAGTAFLLLTSYQYISGGLATTLHFIYPLFVILAGLLFFKQAVKGRKLLSGGICLLGIVFVSQFESGSQAPGIVLALCSAATYAFYTLYLQHSGLGAMDNLKLAFYLQVFGGVFALLWCFAAKTSITDISAAGLAVMGAYSMAFTFLGVVLFQLGVRCVGSETTALLSTMEPVTSILAGSLLLGEHVASKGIIGCALVLLGVLLVTVDGKEALT